MSSIPTLEEVVARFNGLARDLIRDSDVATVATVWIITTHEAHLTSTVVMETVRVK